MSDTYHCPRFETFISNCSYTQVKLSVDRGCKLLTSRSLTTWMRERVGLIYHDVVCKLFSHASSLGSAMQRA